MTTPCQFVEEGPLDDPERQQEIRAHIKECTSCRELWEEYQRILQAFPSVGASYQRRPDYKARLGAAIARARDKKSRRLPWHYMVVGGAVAAAAAALLLWFLSGQEAGNGNEPGLRVAAVEPLPGLSSTRAIEGRLSYAAADLHRPYGVQRSAGGNVEYIQLGALAPLEQRGDLHGLAAASILMGNLEHADSYLERAHQKPENDNDVDSDRALLALLQGDPETALILLDPVLERAPQHPQALWNRALALRELGLPLMAAQAFDQVAALNEPGWHEEARARADRQRALASERKATWERISAHGAQLIRTGAGMSMADVAAQPGLVREYFYEAVRAAPSRAQIDALRPIARALDEQYGSTVLTAYVDRVSRSDFARRAPLAQAYAALRNSKQAASARALIARARKAGADGADIVLGAMRYTGNVPFTVARELLPAYRQMAEDSGDPWFVLLAVEEQAEVYLGRREYAAAEQVLAAALSGCEDTRIDYRCIRVAYWLGATYVALPRASAARHHLESALAWARRANDWKLENVSIEELAEIAYRQDDSGAGSIAVARAYIGEDALRRTDCAGRLTQHRRLAVMLVIQNQMDAARKEMARMTELVTDGTCEAPPLGLQEAFVRAYLLSKGGSAEDVAALQAQLATFRAASTASPADLAFADYVEGRLLIARDRRAAQTLLRRAISAASALPADDVTAQKARSHGYVLLILDAGAHGEFDRALSLLADEFGVKAAQRCVLGVVAEQEVLVVARGSDGTPVAARYQSSAAAVPAEKAVPESVRRALSGCDMVDVFARSPYRGSPQLLPAEVAWRFRTTGEMRAAARLPPRRIVIADVTPPAHLGLPPLQAHFVEPNAVLLRGAAATPTASLAAMVDATEIEIHAHGIIDTDTDDTSFLALSPGPDGQYALTAEDVARHRLMGAPLVILGACHAAYTTRIFHDPSSLASAFIKAGARTVIASPAPIPDADASALFQSLQRRIAAGQPAAMALRDERLAAASAARRAWLDQIVVFE